MNKTSFVFTCACILLVATILPSISGINTASDNKEIVVQYNFEEPLIEKQGTGQSPVKVTIPGLTNTQSPGTPSLPVKAAHILIPQETTVKNIEVQPTNKQVLGEGYMVEEGKNIIPLTAVNTKSKVLSQKTQSTVYQAKRYPQSQFEEVGVHTLKGYQILVLRLYPVHYLTTTGELFYYDSMTVTINVEENKQVSPLFRGLKQDQHHVQQIVDNPSMVVSYVEQPSVETTSASYEYVIITSQRFLNDSQSGSFQDFVQYKQQKGVSATIVTVESIVNDSAYWSSDPLFNDTQAKIRRFIQDAYKNWENEYVLLAGDSDTANPSENIIPARLLYAKTGGLPLSTYNEEGYIPSDVYYACLDGTFNNDADEKWGENATNNDIADEDEADLYAEVWVGRTCVDSLDEMTNFANKTIAYAETENDPYLGNILLVGEYLGFGGAAEYGGNYKDEVKPLIPGVCTINTLYDRDLPEEWSDNDLQMLIEDGVHIINHDGHGWTSQALRMSTYDISQLQNSEFFFLYSHTCLAGSFDNWYPHDNYYEKDCVAEYFTVEAPHGAFATIMNSRYGLGMENSLDSPSQRYDLAFFDALYNQDIREIGRANHASKEANVYRINEPGMRWVYYETNLLGDPEAQIKPVEPIDVDITLDITKPEEGGFYLRGNKLFSMPLIQKPFIIGNITIKANAASEPEGMMERMEFQVDGNIKYVDYKEPYEWKWDTTVLGRHTMNVTAYGAYNSWNKKEIGVRIFNINRD